MKYLFTGNGKIDLNCVTTRRQKMPSVGKYIKRREF